jgi:TRAP-type C4-dicarboxylate transport system permease small subunit
MSILIWVFSVASILLFIYGGIVYATAGGDAERAEKAKKIIIGTIVGIIIFSGSYLIYRTTIKIIGGTQSPELQTEQASEGYGSEDEDTSGDTSQGESDASLPTTQTEDQTNP